MIAVKNFLTETFYMTQTGKVDIPATITQEKQHVASEEIESGETVTLVGSIAAPEATSGTWNGTFNFNIYCRPYNLISFSVDGVDNSYDRTYYAEPGMTWREWCDSIYNVGKLGQSDKYIIVGEKVVIDGVQYIETENGLVTPDEQITDGVVYGLYFD